MCKCTPNDVPWCVYGLWELTFSEILQLDDELEHFWNIINLFLAELTVSKKNLFSNQFDLISGLSSGMKASIMNQFPFLLNFSTTASVI